MFDYRSRFEAAVEALRAERRYRVFADLERRVGHFPWALRGTTIWSILRAS